MKLIRVSPFLLVPTYLFSLIFSAFAILVPGNLASFASVVSLSLLLAHTVLFYLVLDNKPKAAWYYGSYLAFLFALLAFFRFGMETFATFNLAGVVEWTVGPVIFWPFAIAYAVFLILAILNLIVMDSDMKQWIGNLPEKKLTTKKQPLIFAFVTIAIIVFLLVFRFGYYTVENDIPKIDDGFFVTKLEKIEVADSDNLFMDVQNFEYTEDSEARYFSPPQGVSSYYANAGDSKTKSLKERMASCYFGDECRGGLDTYQEAMEGKEVIWTDKKVLSDAGEILVVKAYLKEHIDFLFHYQDKNFDALTEKLLTSFSQKKHYRSSPGNEIFTYREYIWFHRDVRYKTLEYLTLGEEEKGIALLDAQLRTLQIQLVGDSDLIDTFVAISLLKESLNHVTSVLKNFSLSGGSKKILETTLSSELDHRGIMDNSLKNEYKKTRKYLARIPSETTFFNKEYTDRGFRELAFEKIKNKWEVSDAMLEKYFVSLPTGKSNAFGWILWRAMASDSKNQYEKIEELAALRTLVAEALKK